MSQSDSIETLVRRDRAFVLTALVAVTLLAWLYLFQMAKGMSAMPSMMAMASSWTVTDFALMFVMWAVMSW